MPIKKKTLLNSSVCEHTQTKLFKYASWPVASGSRQQ